MRQSCWLGFHQNLKATNSWVFPQVFGAFPKSLHHMSRSARLYRKVWHMPRGLEKSVEMWRHSLWPSSHVRPRRLYLHRDLPAIPHMAEKWSRLSRPFGNQSEIFRNHCGPKYANVFFFQPPTSSTSKIYQAPGYRQTLCTPSTACSCTAQRKIPLKPMWRWRWGAHYCALGAWLCHVMSCPPKNGENSGKKQQKTLMVPMWKDHFFRGTAEIKTIWSCLGVCSN